MQYIVFQKSLYIVLKKYLKYLKCLQCIYKSFIYACSDAFPFVTLFI